MRMELDEPVHVCEYRPEWAVAFAEERGRLAAALGLAAPDLEHIGSTAVAGMLAKPIIDILIGFAGVPPPSIIQKLIELGYDFLGEAGVPGRLYLRRRGTGPTNLQLVAKGGSHWTNNIALRDYLRCSAEARERYRRAKTAALAGGATTLLAYSEAKSATVRTLLDEALAHRA